MDPTLSLHKTVPLPSIPAKPARPPTRSASSSRARYSYQTTATGMTSPSQTASSFWGGGGGDGATYNHVEGGGSRRGGTHEGSAGHSTLGTALTTPSASPEKKDELLSVDTASVGVTAHSPPVVTEDFRALRVRHFADKTMGKPNEALNDVAVDLPVKPSTNRTEASSSTPSPQVKPAEWAAVTLRPLKSITSPRRERTRSITPPITTTPHQASTYNSLAHGVPSPSVGALAGSRIVLDRINRLQASSSQVESQSKGGVDAPTTARRRTSGRHTSHVSGGEVVDDPTSIRDERMTPSSSDPNSDTPTSQPSAYRRRVRPPGLDEVAPPSKPPSPTLQRVGTSMSAKRMIGMYEGLPDTPTRRQADVTPWSGGSFRSSGGRTPSGSAAKDALQAISAASYGERRNGSPVPTGTPSPFSAKYLAGKPLPPIRSPTPTQTTSLMPPTLGFDAHHSKESYAEPSRLLSAYSPHGRMTVPDSSMASKPISVPNSPSKTTGFKSSPSSKSLMSRSPLSKSPLREIIGAFSSVGKKVGRRAGNGSHHDDDRSERFGGKADKWTRKRSETVGSYSGTSVVDAGMAGVGAYRRNTPHVVPRDRMGDREMLPDGMQVPTGSPKKMGPVMYMFPAPCSSLANWTPAAALHPPIITLNTEGGIVPPVSLDLSHCTSIRGLRRDEAKTLPFYPGPGRTQGVADEVHLIEMAFDDEVTRYLAVTTLEDRIAWVLVMLDVLATCTRASESEASAGDRLALSDSNDRKAAAAATGPSGNQVRQRLAEFEQRQRSDGVASSRPLPAISPLMQTAPLQIRNRVSTASLNAVRSPATAADSAKTIKEDDQLRSSVKQLFNIDPNGSPVANNQGQLLDWVLATKADSVTGQKKEEWVPAERDLSVFGPGPSRAQTVKRGLTVSTYKGETSLIDGEDNTRSTMLSFDENDLNPSRSASQRAPRQSTVVNGASVRPADQERTILGSAEPLTVPEPERSSTSTALPIRRQLPAVPVRSSPGADMTEVLQKLDLHSVTVEAELVNLKDTVQTALQSLGADRDVKTQADNPLQKDESLLRAIEQKIVGLQLDVKGLQDSVQLSALAASKAPAAVDLSALETKLEAIMTSIHGIAIVNPDNQHGDASEVKETMATAEANVAEEVSTITTGSSKAAKTLDDPVSTDSVEQPAPETVKVDDALFKQISEVLETVKELQATRAIQGQQTSDMARYLGQLNDWLEKFVLNGTTEIQAMSGRLDRLVAEIAPGQSANGSQLGGDEPAATLPILLAQMHGMLKEQKERAGADAIASQRVDALINGIAQDRQRQEQQQNATDSVMKMLERQRQEHETLLRALATDLTSEIRGERLRFVEAMREATNINVHMHVQEFKKSLTQEIAQHSQELAEMREQKKALELVISDLFAIKAKHANEPAAPRPSPRAQAMLPTPQLPITPRGHTPRPLPSPRH